MSKNLLCVDDSVTVQQMVEITFRHTEYSVTSAMNVEDGLAQARRTQPDLVLADAVMPGKNGYDLCQALKSDPALRGVPVVIMCGNSQAYDEARGKTVGADGSVNKPWDTQAVYDRLKEILSRAASHGPALPAGVAADAGAAPAPAPVPQAVPTPVAAAPRPTPPPAPRPAPTPAARPAPTPPARPAPAAPVARPVPAARPAPAASAARPAAAALPKPPAGLPRPPLIRGVKPGMVAARPGAPRPTPGPVRPGSQVVVPGAPTRPVTATPSTAPRSATIMGMPAVVMPPAGGAPMTPMRPPQPGVDRPASTTPGHVTPAVVARPATAPAPSHAPAVPETPAEAPVVRVAQAAAPAVAAAAAPAVARAVTGDARGPEYEAILRLSREVIEKIAWEVVPELAEVIIKEHVDKLAAAKGRG